MESANYKVESHPETRLDIQSGMLYIQHRGSLYEIHVPTGASFIHIGDMRFPDAKGVRFPQEWAVARFWMAVHRHYNLILGALLVVASLVILQMALALTYPGDMWAHFVAVFSFWMNSAIVIMTVLALTAWYTMHFFKQGVRLDFGGEEKKALATGEISIAPDIIIMSADGEAKESFKKRIDEATESTEGTQTWVLVLAQGNPTFAVLKNTENIGSLNSVTMVQSLFLRTKAFNENPFEEYELNEAARLFQHETYDQFYAWCKALSVDFLRWSAFEKLGKTNHLQSIVDSFKTATVCMLCMLMSFTLSAQKEAQVRAYLGDRAELLKPDAGQLVSFIWENREIEVRSDGGENPIQILKRAPFFTDSGKEGRLLSIKIGGQQVLPKQPSVAVAEAVKTEERIPVLPSPGSDVRSMLESLPDSNSAEAAKAEIMRNRRHDWVKVRPWVELQMWKFYQILGVVLILLAFLLWMAWVSSAEALEDIHGWPFIGKFLMGCYVYSKAISAGVIFAIGFVFALEHAVTYWYTGQAITWSFIIKIVALPTLWYFVVEKLLPNIKRNSVTSSGAYQSPFNNNNQHRLNG